MNKNLLVVILIGIILVLLLPLTEQYSAHELAFTYDNLVSTKLVAK
ncbi:MAG: hypothetical protein ACOX6F_00540 [Syntrophomonadaceae bacterium]|jgi:hypothetical protein|nr:hypothetical protein [Bacillota bacterium]NLM88467.1 hypothetical protein [Syntrophomonadaceae bacterium]HQA49098.1 hypothetical protein [Syntrophomonadaceae bacterium]HQD89470.1 hypothetical protein [Syntrophomonadaceae bacterium]